eukprot:TRINITY_DN3456_c0_g1_i1.p1 TRINITY_DN3456_c0_g1~~TRINITY_DN3456_c0_g1_i1.p1  ORF type:complete len:152 (+),score=42.65 TRINITY_DN3456_c0_g1_i1:28-456(+)
MTTFVARAMRKFLKNYTQVNPQVGDGAIIPKHNYRLPSPGSLSTVPTAAFKKTALTFKEEKLTEVHFADRQIALLASEDPRKRIPDDPVIDPRNFYGVTFDGLPSTPPMKILKFTEMGFNEKGVRTHVDSPTLANVKQEAEN